ncbi:hypothetical protein [Salinimicrobium sp. GXAS 041]|uniref:hypothetical protein n=1 Tax=Salinimicrobium sp. GXAS 041 TaxID=3400806 RepID=UPI003C77DD74
MTKDLTQTLKKFSTSDIKETEAFKNLKPLMQKIVMNKANLTAIHNGYNVSLNIGFEKWKNQAHPSYQNEKIVEELIDN